MQYFFLDCSSQRQRSVCSRLPSLSSVVGSAVSQAQSSSRAAIWMPLRMQHVNPIHHGVPFRGDVLTQPYANTLLHPAKSQVSGGTGKAAKIVYEHCTLWLHLEKSAFPLPLRTSSVLIYHQRVMLVDGCRQPPSQSISPAAPMQLGLGSAAQWVSGIWGLPPELAWLMI